MTLKTVTFEWDDRHGDCYDCGNPAAFFAPDMYGKPGEPVKPENRFCAVCAANHATDGERILRIEQEGEAFSLDSRLEFAAAQIQALIDGGCTGALAVIRDNESYDDDVVIRHGAPCPLHPFPDPDDEEIS